MSTKMLATIAALALMCSVTTTAAHAEDTAAPDKSHEAHHPVEKAAPKDSGKMNMDANGGMMGNMDMTQMHAMMQECMKNHKDGKMCDHSMMQKCEEKMEKGECSKMMSQMKKEQADTKSKK